MSCLRVRQMSRSNLRAIVVGAVVFILGLTAFFFAWAAVDAIRPVPLARTAFAVLSFPVFTVGIRRFVPKYFWELAIVNYVIWAMLAAWLTRRSGRACPD